MSDTERSINIGGRAAGATGIIMGVLVLVSALTGPVAASSWTGTQDCNDTDEFVWVITGGLVNGDKCDSSQLSATIDQMKENQKDITDANIYQGANELKSTTSTSLSARNNSLLNLQTTLFAYGQSTQISSIKNGSSASETNQAVNQSINSRISKMQINHVNAWNQQMQSLRNLAEIGKNRSLRNPRYQGQRPSHGGFNDLLNPDGFAWTPVTLANGSTRKTLIYGFSSASSSNYHWTPSNGTSLTDSAVWSIKHMPEGLRLTGDIGYADAQVAIKGMNASAANDPVTLLNNGFDDPNATVGSRWSSQWSAFNQKALQVKRNLAATTPEMVDQYQAGQLNLTGAVNPLTLAQEYSTKYNESGYYSYALATASASGYAVPDLNGTSTITVRENGLNYTGALLSQNAPNNGTWVVGETYDARQIDGLQLVATTDGNRHELTGNFSIVSIKDREGQSLNSTSVRSYSYQTSNVSEYLQMQQELNDLREQIRQREPTSSSGGGISIDLGGFGLGDIPPAALVGGAVILGGLVLLTKAD